MKTKRIKDGGSFEIAAGEVFRFGCCDCGLTHRMVIVEERPGVFGVALERHNRATSARRRYIDNIKKVKP